MILLDGFIRATFAAALSPIYLDATLLRVTRTENGKGGFTESTEAHACKAQKDSSDRSMQREPGWSINDVKIIVLAGSIDVEPSTQDRVSLAGKTWSIASVRTDAAASHWVLHGQERA